MSGQTGISWRVIPSYPRYEVSNYGAVRNRRTGIELRLIVYRGYVHFFPARGRKLRVHHAVLETFVGVRPPGTEARHLDDNGLKNWVSNLCWGTRLENVADKRRNDRIPVGERSGTAKLTEAQVREIRHRRCVGGESLRSLAIEYGVSHTAIRRAAIGTKWGHIVG